jgi:LDH2 family malate/lactate/ureidoglycolate dehydrogenase
MKDAETYFLVPVEWHNQVVKGCYLARGFDSVETADAVQLCESSARHGIRSHNALKGLHLDELFGSRAGGCIPRAIIQKLPNRFAATEVWDAGKKLGAPVARQAMRRCMELAEKFGTGIVSVDNAFHYIWGGAYVLEAAEAGYIAHTQCTALLAEVAPHGGRRAALGTNPHSWALPTTRALGFPMLLDWATSAISMGKAQQYAREGRQLPPGVALDRAGEMTTDPLQASALLPFGEHKGYSLALLNELIAAITGGYLPSLRGRPNVEGQKNSCCFLFMAIHPDAISSGHYFAGRSMDENIRLVAEDILRGNETARIPGARAAQWKHKSEAAGGLFFTEAEIEGFNKLAEEAAVPPLDSSRLRTMVLEI